MTTWVFVRGLIRSQFHWHEFPQHFKHHVAPEKILFLELPGNGTRCQESSPYSIRSMAKDFWQQLKPIEDRDLRFVAISMGAMIAIEMAIQKPQCVKQLHLINTSLGRYSPPWKRMQLKTLFALAPNLFSIHARERAILRWTSNNPIDDTLLHAWTNEQIQNPTRLPNALKQVLAASRYQGPIAPPIDRTVFYASKMDRLVNSECSQAIATHWQKNIRFHPNAGHDLPLDDPQWLAETIIAESK